MDQAQGAYLVECGRWGDSLTLRTVGCVRGNQSYGNQSWWECAAEGAGARGARLGGCVDAASESRRMRIGESIDRAQTTFECQLRGAGVALVPTGCVLNGDHFRVGQQWQDGNFIFYCRRTVDGACEKTCIGCMLNGQRLYDGDRVRKERTVLQCEVRPKRHALNPVACVSSHVVERAIDCVWSEHSPDGSYRVKRRCVEREGHAHIDTLGCVFEKDGITRLTLKPDTYTMWTGAIDQPALGVACRNTPTVNGEDDWPQLKTFPAEELAKHTVGLESSEPRL